MKKISLKNRVLSGLYLATACCLPAVHAHDVSDFVSAKNATDVYQVQCFQDTSGSGQWSTNPTAHLLFQITDGSTTGGQVSATAVLTSAPLNDPNLHPLFPNALSSTGLKAGLTPAPLLLPLEVPRQSVAFTIFVHHTTDAVADSYLLTFHCQDSAGAHTLTDYTVSQDQ